MCNAFVNLNNCLVRERGRGPAIPESDLLQIHTSSKDVPFPYHLSTVICFLYHDLSTVEFHGVMCLQS